MKNQEIEYGTKLSNGKEIIEILKKRYGSPDIINVTRKIYKTEGSKFFVKVSTEESKSDTRCVFSLKEDLLSQGIDSGMKVSKEVDVSVSSEQLGKLEDIFKLLGYSITSNFQKNRNEFVCDGLSLVVDNYAEGDYFEAEGQTQDEITKFVSSLPINKID